MGKKRPLKALGIVLGAGLALFAILYIARRPLFESTIANRVQSALATILDADIEVSGISGNWITEFIVEGVDIRGKKGSAYEGISGLDLTVHLSLPDLIGGDLSGLHLARIHAERVVLNFDGAWYPEPTAEPIQDDSSNPWRDLLGLFDQGGTVEVDELVLKPDYIEPGPCKITMAPGRDRRDVVVKSGKSKVLAHIDRQGRYGIEVFGNQSGRLLRALGVVEQAMNPGAVDAQISGHTSPQQVALELEFDARLESGATIGSHCMLELRAGRLIAQRLDIDLPGISVSGSDLDIPVAQLSNKELREVLQHQGTGRLSAKITDLALYRALLPQSMLELLPITGGISLDVRKGVVLLQPSLLHAKGFDLRISNGSFSLVDLDDISLQQLQNVKANGVAVKLTAQDPVTINLGQAGSMSWAGKVEAKVSGTVFDPNIDTDLQLRDASFSEFRVAKLDCRVSYRGETLSLEGLELHDAARGAQLLVRNATGKASLRLPRTGDEAVVIDTLDVQIDRPDVAARIELESLRFGGTADMPKIVMSGRVDVTRIDPLLFEPSVRDELPRAPFVVQVRASASGDTLDIGLLKVTWGTENSRLIALDARGPIPIRWLPGSSPVSRQVKEAFTANLRFVDAEPFPGQPEIEILAVLSVDAKNIRIPSFEARAANGFIKGEQLRVGVTLADLLGGMKSLRSAEVGGKLFVHEYAFGNFLSKLLVGTKARGLLEGEVSIGGTVARPTIKGQLDVQHGHLDRKGLPGMDDIQIVSSFTENHISLDYQAEVSGRTPVKFSAILQSVDAPLWEAGEKSSLRGALTVRDLDLALLPTEMIGVDDLSGVVNGKFSISGNWDELRPTLDLDLKNASCRALSLPRIENLHAKIVADTAKFTIHGTGDLGAAPVTVKVAWIAGNGAFPKRFLAGEVDATIRGDDVLLIRTGGLKVRGDVDLTAKGGLEKIDVRGTVKLSNSKYIKRLSLVPDLKVRSEATSGAIFGPWSFPGGERFEFDIRLETREAVTVATNVLDTKLDVGCNMVGQGSGLHLEGACVARMGILRFPGMAMQLNGMRLVFSKANPTHPEIFATATGQRHGIRIHLQAKGPWDEPAVTLRSTPALQPKELWALATTGVQTSSLAQNDTRANTAILATYVLQEALLANFASESTEASESFGSRFVFEFGNEISRGGQETWQVDFDIGGLWVVPPKLGMRIDRDVYEDLNMGLVYRWRF